MDALLVGLCHITVYAYWHYRTDHFKSLVQIGHAIWPYQKIFGGTKVDWLRMLRDAVLAMGKAQQVRPLCRR